MIPDDPAKFDLDAQLARIDRQQAELHDYMSRTNAIVSRGINPWMWSLAIIVPIIVGVVLAYAL